MAGSKADVDVDIDLNEPQFYIHRELSLLSFFRRVLSMASDPSIPALEKLRFLTICSQITDEFFEIRVAGLKQRIALGIPRPRPDRLGQHEALRQISETVSEMVAHQYSLLNDTVLPHLETEDIKIIRRIDWTKKQKKWIRDYFEEQVSPVLTPVGLDLAHPFPRVMNKSLNMIVSLDGVDAYGRATEFAVVPVPRCLPRLIQLPVSVTGSPHHFVMLSSVIHAFVEQVFPGLKIRGCHQFRVTRNADLWVEEEEVEDLLSALKGELFSRRYGDAVRLEVASNCPASDVALLQAQFNLTDADVYRVDGPVNLHRLDRIYSLVERPDLKFPVFAPGNTEGLSGDIFEKLGRHDVLLHHPYQSFAPVVEMVRQAAEDPSVLAIKQTVYRTGTNSPFLEALIKAARSGKEVTAVVELRARFDEAANIDLATQLQDAGANVVYGVVGFKTHAKMLLVVRREGGKLRRYAHLGTGNYHTGTARAYTDFSFMTSNEAVTQDVHHVFMQLTSLGRAETLLQLKQSPFTLKKWLIERLEYESAEARAGRKAHVICKMNSFSHPALIRAVYRASQAGVKIELIVRGICCLRPGIPGVSENVSVRSIVGRFLEHSRLFYFHAGGEEQVFGSSADWMVRNLDRRVETCFPITDPALKQRVMNEGLLAYLRDNQGAWALESDGSYTRLEPSDEDESVCAQDELLRQLGEV